MTSLTEGILSVAESFSGIRAGVARLEDVLDGPSYRAVPDIEYTSSVSDDGGEAAWPPGAGSVLVLGLHHPEEEPRLDWWEGGRSPGDRRLVRVAQTVRRRLRVDLDTETIILPYAESAGGVFLKDAAVFAGLGTVGRNNLLVTPDWGPRVRFRALLVGGELEPTGPLKGFLPCESCARPCRDVCPRDAFARGSFRRASCMEQMDADEGRRRAGGGDGASGGVVKYCRACEFACPVGA